TRSVGPPTSSPRMFRPDLAVTCTGIGGLTGSSRRRCGASPRAKGARWGAVAGGVPEGEPVWALVHYKPISTLLHPLRSVDIHTGAEINAHYERSDICVVPAGAVVAEAMLAWVLAAATMEKFGGDNLGEVRRAAAAHRRAVSRLR